MRNIYLLFILGFLFIVCLLDRVLYDVLFIVIFLKIEVDVEMLVVGCYDDYVN